MITGLVEFLFCTGYFFGWANLEKIFIAEGFFECQLDSDETCNQVKLRVAFSRFLLLISEIRAFEDFQKLFAVLRRSSSFRRSHFRSFRHCGFSIDWHFYIRSRPRSHRFFDSRRTFGSSNWRSYNCYWQRFPAYFKLSTSKYLRIWSYCSAQSLQRCFGFFCTVS